MPQTTLRVAYSRRGRISATPALTAYALPASARSSSKSLRATILRVTYSRRGRISATPALTAYSLPASARSSSKSLRATILRVTCSKSGRISAVPDLYHPCAAVVHDRLTRPQTSPAAHNCPACRPPQSLPNRSRRLLNTHKPTAPMVRDPVSLCRIILTIQSASRDLRLRATLAARGESGCCGSAHVRPAASRSSGRAQRPGRPLPPPLCRASRMANVRFASLRDFHHGLLALAGALHPKRRHRPRR